jgi:proline dehydrogenase
MSLFNRLLVIVLPLVPKFVVGFFSRKYIAGPSLQQAVEKIRELNAGGIMSTIDILGEETEKKADALEVVEEYKKALAAIDMEGLDANVSIKPTHLGLKIDKEFCYDNIRVIIEEAEKYNNFIRIDMEDHTCTSDTLEIFLRLREKYSNVGVVIQTYMRRTVDDVNKLIIHKANLRICKGIYDESRSIAYKDPEIINDNFKYNLEKLLNAGCYIGIATHDERLIWYALSLIDKLDLKQEDYEFQMLLGVTQELRDILVSAGHRMRVYVPYGEHWHAYSMRRLKENPNIAGYIIKNMFI